MSRRMKPFAKFLIVVAVMGGLFALYRYVIQPALPGAGSGDAVDVDLAGTLKRPIRVCVVTWGGYAGGQYFNEGFRASKESRFYKDYGILVEFIVNDDFNASREAWKSDKVDLLWITADSFPTEAKGLLEYEPKIIFQADWSRGGDAIVVRRGINNVGDLKGKKVAVAFGTPSHTFLLWLLQAGDLQYSDIEVVQAPNAIDAASYFKAGKVDAAVVWSPDDEDCVKNVSGAKVLKSTREASRIIADVFYVKNEFLRKHQDDLRVLVEGWMKGAAEINASAEAKNKAARILAEGLGQPEDFCLQAINNVRLCTYGDNVNFFNLKGDYRGTKGEDLYATMTELYTKINIAESGTPNWRQVVDTSILRMIRLDGAAHAAEGEAKFAAATEEVRKAEAFAAKPVRISFASGSSALDENAKYIIDKEMAPLAKAFANARVRIEGNTDTVGERAMNVELSRARAWAVANFLQKEYGFDVNRFVVVGNGPDKPVADNATEDGRAKNRRTEFQILN